MTTDKQQAVALHAGKARVRELLGRNELDQALTLCESLYRDYDADAETCFLTGSILGRAGRYREAVDKLQQAIAMRPDAFQAHYLLGVACSNINDPVRAAAAFRSALELRPDSLDVMMDLATALVDARHVEQAGPYLQQLANSPRHAATALHLLGRAALASGKPEQSIDYFRRALQIDPERADTYNRLGRAYYQAGNLREAIDAYASAIHLQPDIKAARTNLAVAYMNNGEFGKAMQTIEQALALAPDDINGIATLAWLQEQAGNYQAAYDLLAPQVEKNIHHPGIAATYVNICLRLDCREQAVAYAGRVLDDERIQPLSKRQVYAALGKLHDRLGNYDEAFHNHEHAHALRQDTFNPVEFMTNIDTLTRFFSWQFFQSAPRSTIHSSRPVFIIGMPRSGTSLTEQILASHPDVYGAGELSLLGQLSVELSAGGDYPENMGKITTAELDRLATRYLDGIAQLDDLAGFVIDKMPHNFLHLGLIPLLFPKAHIIHCLRDPRDTCLSIYFQNFNEGHDYANRLDHLGLYYRQYEKLVRSISGVIDIPVLEVHYEELVANPEDMSRRLLEFLGLPWDERCLDFHRSKRLVSTASYEQVRRPIYSSSVGRWKHYQKHLGPLLEALEHRY